MIYIFSALYCEAEPVIRRLSMKAEGGRPFAMFADPEGKIRVVITGIGKTNAAAAAGYVCAAYNVTARDVFVNLGTCAGSEKGVYLINKVTDGDTGRCCYPDMLLDLGLPEREVTTVSRVATEEMTREFPQMLWEMEASGFLDGAGLFLPPHRIYMIKAVSDSGSDDTKNLTEELLRDTIEDNIDAIMHALDVISGSLKEDVTGAADAEGYAGLFKCSETMRQDLIKILTYCRNSGKDASRIIRVMSEEGMLPAPDRRSGKEALNEFRRRIVQ